jgi:hypothetical protein
MSPRSPRPLRESGQRMPSGYSPSSFARTIDRIFAQCLASASMDTMVFAVYAFRVPEHRMTDARCRHRGYRPPRDVPRSSAGRSGDQVVSIHRSLREPYTVHPTWNVVERVTVDRVAEEQANNFGSSIRNLQADAVIDLTCYTLERARHLVTALRAEVQLPALRDHLDPWTGTQGAHDRRAVTRPISDYGRRKLAIEEYLLNEARRHGFPATVLYPATSSA